MGDRAYYLTDGLRPVVCAGCGSTVLVRKQSTAQTSVQWDVAAVATCAEFTAAGGSSALIAGCATLRESITAAVRAGTVEVPDG